MPELAEVHYFAQKWRRGLGQTVLRVHCHGGKRVFRGVSLSSLIQTLTGQPLNSIQTHGKQMLFRFGRNGWLGIHLGMTGQLSAESKDYRPTKHDHLVLYIRKHALIFRDPRLFGRVRFAPSPEPPPWWSSLPPALFSKEFSVPRLRSICQRRSRSPLKPLLLMQPFFPGVGNWMADEILWQTRLHPLLPVCLVEERGSTLAARERFWQLEPPRGWRRLLPAGLRQPPRDWDDVVAQLLLERYLGHPLERRETDGPPPIRTSPAR
jgi:formamidopyrimidine-DNA glycosylase